METRAGDVEGGNGRGGSAAGWTGTKRVESLGSKNASVVDAALATVPFRSGSTDSTTSCLAFFGDDVWPEVAVAAAAAGDNAANLRHPPFRSGI